MPTNVDGDEACRHGFTGLPEDCVRCARESYQTALTNAHARGRNEGIEAAAKCFYDNADRPDTGPESMRKHVHLALQALAAPPREAACRHGNTEVCGLCPLPPVLPVAPPPDIESIHKRTMGKHVTAPPPAPVEVVGERCKAFSTVRCTLPAGHAGEVHTSPDAIWKARPRSTGKPRVVRTTADEWYRDDGVTGLGVSANLKTHGYVDEEPIVILLASDYDRMVKWEREARELLLDFERNWDCDSDAHRYGTGCRCCQARAFLAETKGSNDGK